MKVRDIIGLVDYSNIIFIYDGKITIREDDKEYSNYFDKNVMVISGTENEYGECIVLEVE